MNVKTVYLFKKHRVSAKTVEKHRPIALKIRRYPRVYSENPTTGFFEDTELWMLYVIGKGGKEIYWWEERRPFHMVRFRVLQIVTALQIARDRIAYEDLTDSDDVALEDFLNVI